MSRNVDWKESIEGAQTSIHLTKSQVAALLCLESLFVAGLLQSIAFQEIDSAHIIKEGSKEVVARRRVNFLNKSSSQRQISTYVFKKEDNSWEYYQAVIYSSTSEGRTPVDVYSYTNDGLWLKDEKASSS